MNAKERMLTTMHHGIADRVPVCPDMSNMIPARLVGKPFWDIYLYQDPPLWLAYIEAVRHFGFDGFLGYQVKVTFPDERAREAPWQRAIIERTDERIVVRDYTEENGAIRWKPTVTVYPRYETPAWSVAPEKLGLAETPERWEPVEGVKPWPEGEELFALAYEMMGDAGVVGMVCGTSMIVGSVEKVYEYYDHPDAVREAARLTRERFCKRFDRIMQMKVRPDYIGTGASGTLVFQTVEIFRDVSLPIVRDVTRRCKEAGIASHLHSCGPETALVKICAQETDLDVIDPLEVPPMGDCDLAELKAAYGDRLVLKGNLHTTEVMLRGGYDDVMEAGKQAIRDAGHGGGFILSTGDQCGRDTPDENIRAMIDAVEKYGRY